MILRRITSSGRFIPEIDGLRFAAIASVILYHFYGFVAADPLAPKASGAFRVIAEHGYRGVNLFYVISGFVLGLPFAGHYLQAKPPVSLRAYFLRRLSRLEVPYILNLLICFAVAGNYALLPHLAASAGYVHNIVYGAQSTINPVAWTLEVEVQFYCLVPVLAALFRIRSKTARRTIIVALILAAGCTQALYWDAPARLRLSLAFAIQFFLSGFLLADIYLADWRENPDKHWAWDLLGFACWPAIFAAGDRAWWPVLPLLMLGAYYGAFRGIVFNRIFRNTLIATIGGMCYSLYLFHYLLIPPMLGLAKNWPADQNFVSYFAVRALIYVPAILLVGGAFFVLVERPCMSRDWPQRLMRRIGVTDAI